MIPDYLQKQNRWTVFRKGPKVKGKYEKKPSMPNGSQPPKGYPDLNNKKHVTSYTEVKKLCDLDPQFIPAIYLLEKDGLICIDIDNYGSAEPDYPTFTEKTLSGGYHIIGWYKGKPDTPYECYTDRRWVVMTGDTLPGKEDINDLTDFFKSRGQTEKFKAPYKAPDKISEGARNTELHRMSCALAAKGLSDPAVLAAVLEENKNRCIPPLLEDEMRGIVTSACEFNRKNPLPLEKGSAGKSSDITEGELESIRKAEEILHTGSPLDTLLHGFRFNHRGHEETARSIIYAACLQSSRTTKGLQPSVTGDKGSGKSHGVGSTIHLMPPEYVWNSTLSTKALYYNKPPEKCIIYIDEKIPDDLIDLIKRVMTNFQQETIHKTVVDKKGADLHIPKRLVFLNTSVYGAQNDQLRDRILSIGILNEKKDDESYYEFEMQRRMEGRPEFEINEHILLCREIMRHIKKLEFIVKIPKIDFAYKHDTRLMNQIFDLMEASAILNYMQREHEEKDGVIYVMATAADLSAALNFSMFTIADKNAEGRLTRAERALDETLQNHLNARKKDEDEFTEGEIATIYGKTQQSIRKLIYGPDGNQHKWDGGLLEKAPWYHLDRTQRDDFKGQTVIKVQRHFYEVEKGSFAYMFPELVSTSS